MNDQRHDDEFEEFLDGKSKLTERYTALGREEPPPEIDARILAAARDSAKIHRLEFGPRGGWLKPVALAATVLLSFSLVMNIVIDMPVRFEQVITGSSDRPADAGATMREEKGGIQEPNLSVSSSTAAVDGADAGESVIGRARSADDAAALAPLPLAEISVQARRLAGLDFGAAMLIVTDYVAATDRQRRADDSRSFTARRQAPAKAESVRDRPSSPAPAEPAPVSTDERDRAADPESWLREIASLSAAGANEAADERLVEFLDRYPDHPVSVKIRGRGE